MRDRDFLNHFLEKGYFEGHSRVVLALSGGFDVSFSTSYDLSKRTWY